MSWRIRPAGRPGAAVRRAWNLAKSSPAMRSRSERWIPAGSWAIQIQCERGEEFDAADEGDCLAAIRIAARTSPADVGKRIGVVLGDCSAGGGGDRIGEMSRDFTDCHIGCESSKLPRGTFSAQPEIQGRGSNRRTGRRTCGNRTIEGHQAASRYGGRWCEVQSHRLGSCR